jgi:hypothetical protein
LVGQAELLGGGGALVAGLAGFDDLAIPHPVGVVGKVRWRWARVIHFYCANWLRLLGGGSGGSSFQVVVSSR